MYHLYHFPHRSDFIIKTLQHDLSLLAVIDCLIITSRGHLSAAFFFDGAVDIFLHLGGIPRHDIKRCDAICLLRQRAEPVILDFGRQAVYVNNFFIPISGNNVIRFLKSNTALWLQRGEKRKIKETFFFCKRVLFLFSHDSSSLIITELAFAILNRI